MAACDAAIATSPSIAPGDERMTPYDLRTCTSGRVRSACGSVPPIATNGSGKSSRQNTIAPTPNSSPAKRYGPMNSSSPIQVPARFSNGVRIGPNTAPSVPTHTIAPIAFARSSGCARSAATYRAWSVAA